jgi:beta-lactamase regulating signal transducer with metallopeptidase domain
LIPFLEDFEQIAAEAALPTLLSHLWASTLFLAILLAFLVVARRRLTSKTRFALVMIGIVKFAIPGNLVALIASKVTPNGIATDRGAFDLPSQLLGGAFDLQAALGNRVSGILVLAWALVALSLFVRNVHRRRHLVTLVRRTASPPGAQESAALERAKRRLRVCSSVDMVRTPVAEAPAVLRIIRPLIILPSHDLTSLSGDELESLLSHECAHVARRDNLVATLESAIVSIFWFHPLVWIAHRVASRERERACDEAVADAYERPLTYLRALSRYCHAAVVPRVPGVSRMATSHLKERLDHLAGYGALKSRAFSARPVIFPAILGLLGFTLASAVASTDRFKHEIPGPQTEIVWGSPMEAEPSSRFSGRLISLSLKNANLRDVIATVTDLTGASVHVADDVDGTATVELVNVRWDQALDSIVRDNDIKYEIRRGTIYISKR